MEETEAPPAPAAPADLGRRSVHSALWLLFAGLVINGVAHALHTLLMTGKLARLYGKFAELEEEELTEILESLRFYDHLFSMISAAAAILAAIALFNLARARLFGETRPFAVIGVVAFAVFAVLLASVLTVSSDSKPGFVYGKAWTTMVILAPAIAFAMTVVCATRIARELRRPLAPALVAVAVLWIAWDAGWPLYRFLGEIRIEMAHQSPWLYNGLMTAIWLGGTAAMACVVAFTATALEREGTAEGDFGPRPGTAGGLSPEGWRGAAEGLKLYGDALAWRLGITVCAYVLLFMAVSSKSVGLAKFVGWALPLAALVTGLVMITAVFRYSRQPDGSPGRSSSYAAFAFMVIGAALEGYGLLLMFKVITVNSSNWDSVRAARDAAESAQSLSVWAMIVGFSALLALLVSFQQVATYIGDRQLARRVITVAVLLISAAGAAIGFRLYIQDARIGLGAAVVLAISVLGYTLIAVVSYISLTRGLERAIREAAAGAPSELPTARIVSG